LLPLHSWTNWTGEQSTGEQSTGEQSTGEQATGEQSTGEQSTGEQEGTAPLSVDGLGLQVSPSQ
jgi:hypothetical protein